MAVNPRHLIRATDLNALRSLSSSARLSRTKATSVADHRGPVDHGNWAGRRHRSQVLAGAGQALQQAPSETYAALVHRLYALLGIAGQQGGPGRSHWTIFGQQASVAD